MLKKNTRKRLLAGALATVMMLTMCPSWALADDEDIATLPANEEIAVPVVDSTPAADTTETPAVPTPSETEAKPAEDQNTAPAPSDDGANGGTDVAESGNSTNSTVSEDSENNSQNNDAVSNAPENEIASQDAPSHDAEVAPAYLLSDVTKTAECWVTNRHAADSDGNWKTTITNAVGDGADVTTLAAPTIEAGNETYVFWQARVLPIGQHQSNILNGDRTKDGTEIDRIRYVEATWTSDYFEYREKDTDSWKKFKTGDQLVFYYLVRTDYSEMVQIDVSDWTVNEEPSYDDRRSVTYQIIVDGGVDDGKVLDSKKFWYNKAFKVSSIRVREIGDHPNYSIDRVVLEPSTLGDPTKNENGEYRFSLDLNQIKAKHNATVNIYVTPNVEPHKLTYVLNDGEITSAEGTYTPESLVYPDETVTTPEVAKDNCTFDGWYTDSAFQNEWKGTSMPDKDLTLYAKWTASIPTQPEPKLTPAKYFVLLPNRGKPDNNHDQGKEFYLPNATSNGGVEGKNTSTGYTGALTAAGVAAAGPNTGDDSTNGIYDVNGYGSDYLVKPTELGFFDEDNWSNGSYNDSSADISILGENFDVKNIEIVWYTIKNQDDGYHVDGYVKNVAINVTYHSNFGEGEIYNHGTKTGTNYEALSYAATGLRPRENYTFGGWYTDIECTKPYTQQVLMTSKDLYAKWVPINSKVSYFYKNEQDVDTQFGDIDTYAFGTDVTVRTAHPEKEGYTFTGWTNIANIVTVDTTTGKFTMPAQNVRFDATFEINQYNVTYKVDGKVDGDPDVYDFNLDVAIRPVPTKDGYTFTGWTSNDSAFDIRGFKMPAHNVVIEGKFEKNPAKQYTYTVNKHFYDEKGVEVNVEKGEAKTAVENTAVSELYKDAAVKQTVDGKTYVYVSGLTTVTDNLEKLTKDVTIDLYYYLNVEGGNDIPDAWEYRLTFKVVNGEWNDGGNADIVTYVQFKDQTTGEAFKDEAVVVPVTRIPAVGDKPNSGYHAGAWDTSPYDNYKVQKDTVFTYTYAKNSSGGSSGGHHRRPTVTIPDDVPTGLNGDDHYAYIVGYPDKTVRPQNGITRAEVATIFFRLLTDETRDANSTKSNSYSDVAAGAWYNHAVSTLSAMGIVKGDSHGRFNPDAPITRAEFAAIAARFDDKANTTTADFSDIASHWAKNEISAASNNGWITGYPDGTFRPDNKITRAEAMTLVNRVLKRLPETEEDLHDDMIKWSDNSDVSQWFYLDVQEATNSHYYQTKENQFEKWTELRETRDWTELEK